MKPRAFLERAQRIIDALSARIDAQALGLGADAPHCVSTVGAFHRCAGGVEGDLANPRTSRATVCAMIRVLRKFVGNHRLMVAQRALYLRNTRRAQ